MVGQVLLRPEPVDKPEHLHLSNARKLSNQRGTPHKYYDPSYGVIYESVQKIDETLSGFYNKPLFEDEIYFRKNPSGVQIEFYE